MSIKQRKRSEKSVARKSGPCRNAQGRRHHGRHHRRSGAHRRTSRRLRRNGTGTRALRYSQRWGVARMASPRIIREIMKP